MSIYRIPLSSKPQMFNISLANKEYNVTVRWNAAIEGGWFMDIAKPDNGEPIVSGIPVVTGVDLLGQYGYLNFGGSLVCWSDNSDAPPTFENLGLENELLFVVDDG